MSDSSGKVLESYGGKSLGLVFWDSAGGATDSWQSPSSSPRSKGY